MTDHVNCDIRIFCFILICKLSASYFKLLMLFAGF